MKKKVFHACRRRVEWSSLFPLLRLLNSCKYLSGKQPPSKTNIPKSLRAQDHHPIPIHLSLSVFSCLSHPPLPPLIHCSITQEELVFLKTSSRAWKGARPRGAGTWRGNRGCFCHSSAPLVTAGLTVVHPEETRLTSLWPGPGPTRAAWSGQCDAAVQKPLTQGSDKDVHALRVWKAPLFKS